MSKILVIQTAFIGDVILVTPLFRAIRQELMGSQTYLIVIPETKSIVENNPFVKQLWIYDKKGKQKGIGGFRRLIKQIKEEKFDIALLPHRSYRTALLTRFANIPIRIGFNRSPANWLYSHVVEYQSSQHEIFRNLSLLEPFGASSKEIIPPEIFARENDISAVDEILNTYNVPYEKNLITIAPGSIWPTKRWPESHFSELIDLFFKDQNNICLIGSEKDKKNGEQICENASGKVYNFIGKLSLTESTELLRRSNLLICNDSAPTHMGSAVNVPTISIFGSTVPEFGFGPVAEKNKILQKDLSCRPCTDHGRIKCPIKTMECLKSITPQKVYNAAKELIN